MAAYLSKKLEAIDLTEIRENLSKFSSVHNISKPLCPIDINSAPLPGSALLAVDDKDTRSLEKQIADIRFFMAEQETRHEKEAAERKKEVAEMKKEAEERKREIEELQKHNTNLYAPLLSTRELVAVSLLKPWLQELDKIAIGRARALKGNARFRAPQALWDKLNGQGSFYKKLAWAASQERASPAYGELLKLTEDVFLQRHKLVGRVSGDDLRKAMRLLCKLRGLRNAGCHYWELEEGLEEEEETEVSMETRELVLNDLLNAMDKKLFEQHFADESVQKILRAAVDKRRSEIGRKRRKY